MRIVFFLFLFLVHSCRACRTRVDCAPCQYCNSETRTCTNVPIYTDPFDDCKEKCNTEMVCGLAAYCVFKSAPVCNCNWERGVCIDKKDSTIVETEPSLLLLPQSTSLPPLTSPPQTTLQTEEVLTNRDVFLTFQMLLIVLLFFHNFVISHRLQQLIELLTNNPKDT